MPFIKNSRQAGFPRKPLYEDSALLIINKFSGLRVEHIIPEDHRNEFFLAHRLDKDTSGVLLLAKGEENLRKLQQQWKKGSVKKIYIALVKGNLEPKRGRIEAALFRSMKNRTRIAVSRHLKARPSFTEYKVLQYFHDTTLLQAYPLTGRTHQIRVHFSSIGHPIIGDKVYGDAKLNKKIEQEYGLTRQFLHAAKLTFTHPSTKKRITFEAPLAEDLEKVLEKLSSLLNA